MTTSLDQKKLERSDEILAESRRLQDVNQKLVTEDGGRHEFEFCGEKFVNFPDVYYHPGYDAMALNLPEQTVDGARFLEIGCGTGCISVIHYLRNKSKLNYVLATDINRQALENTKVNFERHAVPGEVRYSDVFENLREDEKFDLIFWHPPYLYQRIGEVGDLSILDRSLVDRGYEAIGRFITEARDYLRPGGRAVFSFGSNFGFLEVLNEKAKKANLTVKKIWHEAMNYSEILNGDIELWQVIPNSAE